MGMVAVETVQIIHPAEDPFRSAPRIARFIRVGNAIRDRWEDTPIMNFRYSAVPLAENTATVPHAI